MYLTHKNDVFTIEVAGKDDEAILKELKDNDYKMGRTSLRNLLSGAVSEACGFVLGDDDGAPLPDERDTVNPVRVERRRLNVEKLPTLNVAPRVSVADATEEDVMVAQAKETTPRNTRNRGRNKPKDTPATQSHPLRRSTDVQVERVSITDWIEKFQAGEFDDEDVRTQVAAGWGEWGCLESALPAKTKRLGRKMMRILNTDKFNPEETYVVFMNKSPDDGPRIDYFEIYDLKTNDRLYSVTPRGRGANNVNAAAGGHENGFKKPLVTGSWSDVINYFVKK